MEFYRFPVPKDMPSFPTWEQYYEYIKSYAEHFNLYKHIQVVIFLRSVRTLFSIKFLDNFAFITKLSNKNIKKIYPRSKFS